MSAGPSLDVARIRKDFPILSREVDAGRLVYLDSANTSQKPQAVLDAMDRYYEQSNANVHRGTYQIAIEATEALEGGRAKIRRFIGAPSDRTVVFTKNATEALNLVVRAWGTRHLREGDAVVLSEMEHHANIVPWHQLREAIGIELRWIPVTADGQLDLTDLDRHLDGAKVLSFTAMSNVLGTITPVEQLVARAHDAGALAVVDASQHVPHLPTDVQAWDADLVAFSSHKMCGPSGIGLLWGRGELLDAIPTEFTQRVGICLDTAHVWAAGYDLVNEYDAMIDSLDNTIGLARLGCLHLNDSKAKLGSHLDRHEQIGEGAIGEGAFRRIMTDARLQHVPRIIETPKGTTPAENDSRALKRLRDYGKGQDVDVKTAVDTPR